MGIVAIFILGVLVFFHELGHFLVAKYFRVGVLEFAVGFGPKVFSFVRNDTRYSLRIIPLGGFVKMAGETREALAQTPEEEGYDTHEQAILADKSGWLINKPLYARAATVFAGPLFNLIFAYALAVVVISTYGVAKPTDSTVIGEVMEKYPAELAGIKPGDKVIEINGNKIGMWPQIREQIGLAGEGPILFTVERNGEQKTFDPAQ